MKKEALGRVNKFLQDYLILALGIVLAAVIFYWFSYTTLIDRVSATETKTDAYGAIIQRTYNSLESFHQKLDSLGKDMSTVKEKVSNLEKQ